LTHANETKKNTSIDSIFFSPKKMVEIFWGGLFYSNRVTATDRLVTLSTTVKKPMKLFLMSGLERDRALLPTPIGSTQHSKISNRLTSSTCPLTLLITAPPVAEIRTRQGDSALRFF
jgi:hypothetical protein